jgi:hypothetical protein
MARDTECPVCQAYIPVELDAKHGEYVYCSYCGAQLRLGVSRSEEEEEMLNAEEDWGDEYGS